MLYFIPSLFCKVVAPTAAAVVLSTFICSILILHLLFYLNMSRKTNLVIVVAMCQNYSLIHDYLYFLEYFLTNEQTLDS